MEKFLASWIDNRTRDIERIVVSAKSKPDAILKARAPKPGSEQISTVERWAGPLPQFHPAEGGAPTSGRRVMKPPKLPKIITHANMDPLLDRISREPAYQPGARVSPPEWVHTPVVLEVPLGELAEGGLKTLALTGGRRPEVVDLTGKEGFDAQGLEGKVRIQKDLFAALMNLRDLIAPYRGRILTRGF